MRFVDENCGNCRFFVSVFELLSEIKSVESRKLVESYLEATSDTGNSCCRFPESIETIPEGWCGEHKPIMHEGIPPSEDYARNLIQKGERS